ncbi:MAG: DUF1559 domain-containing protein [Candidatus Omnitrophica bacterium]|nr:DUF1559 domain-containing protein [Candidatus Omnitrophota bacterium]
MLAALLLPALARAREQARRGVCVSNLKQIGLALKMYAQDYDENFPDRSGNLRASGVVGEDDDYTIAAFNKLLGYTNSTRTAPPHWRDIRPCPNYLKDPGIFICPSQKKDAKSSDVRITKKSECSYAYAMDDAGWTTPLNEQTQDDYVVVVDKQTYNRVLNSSADKRWNTNLSGSHPTCLILETGSNHGIGGVNALFVGGAVNWIATYRSGNSYIIPSSGDYKGIPNYMNLRNP